MLKNSFLQRTIGGGFLEALGIGTLSQVEYLALRMHKDRELVRFLRRTRGQRRSLVTGFETFMVYSLANSTRNLPGDIAEVGVFQGSTARIICEVKGDRRFRLFDTFEGLPKGAKEDRGVHRENQYTCSLESVREYLKDFEGLSFHKGRFPESAEEVEEANYSFVHLDVDLYESTLAGLTHFYPLMVPGGIMLSHDYSILAGVEQACQEFVADKPENLIELTTTQCMIVKLPTTS